jgi:protein-S-isoprenylcysteine O-methyltransferase Ste14
MTAPSTGVSQEMTGKPGARVVPVPPPLYYAIAFGAGLLLRSTTVPLAAGGRPVTAALGVAAVATGAALALAGVVDVVRHGTTIVPHHRVSALVTTGAYRICRNPMYTGLAIAYVGAGLLADTWWPLLFLPFALLAVRRIVIDPEERYLEHRFGQLYADYRARVRRWL